MSWEVEYTDEFEEWWTDLDAEEQVSVEAVVEVLAEMGSSLPFPYSSDLKSSRHGNMRELRVQHRGRPYRVLYAFDPRRVALLLLGGTKRGGAPKEQRERAAARRDEILREISLKQLRRALRLTQVELAGTLRVNQAAISKMESQYDMYISTLRRVLEAMGARLKIIAEFPDGQIVISQFHQKARGKARA